MSHDQQALIIGSLVLMCFVIRYSLFITDYCSYGTSVY